MATYTTKYHLKKPALEDFGDVADINSNMDIIDETLTSKADLGEDGKVPLEQLPELGSDLELGETSDTAYRGDRGKTAYDHSQTKNSNPHETAAKDIDYTDNEELGATNVQDAIDAVALVAKTAQATADDALEAITEIAFTINTVPTQSGSLTYTGSAQSPTWNSYDPNALQIGGTTTGTNAGTYQATFTPKSPYKWADGTTDARTVNWTIGRAGITLPTQSGSLTYTGATQSPSWSGYDSNKMTLGGTTSGTNAGSYSASFTPKANYQWTDGTTGAKTAAWSIGKATGSLTLSKSSVSIGVSSKTDTVTVTRSGDGAITATSNNSAIATASVSGTTITITAKASGSTTITVKVAAGTNYTAPANKTINVTVQMLSPTLANNTWAQIAAASEAGVAASTWSVGDTKNITVGGETLTVEIVGFNHDDLASGGKAGITFGLKNLMANTRQMNSSNTNAGGFTGSDMYDWLQGTLLNSLPSDLRAVLKSVNKKTSAGSQSSTINTNAMKIFLFSEIEIFGSVTYSKSGEGSQYSRFATASSRIKYRSNGSGSASVWWERSPYGSNSNGFCRVNSSGGAASNNANYSRGVCFGFCV